MCIQKELAEQQVYVLVISYYTVICSFKSIFELSFCDSMLQWITMYYFPNYTCNTCSNILFVHVLVLFAHSIHVNMWLVSQPNCRPLFLSHQGSISCPFVDLQQSSLYFIASSIMHLVKNCFMCACTSVELYFWLYLLPEIKTFFSKVQKPTTICEPV
jgi:hypothetical protein